MDKKGAAWTIQTLHQFITIANFHKQYGKVIDENVNLCYSSCAFPSEVNSGSLVFYPEFIQKRHSSRLYND